MSTAFELDTEGWDQRLADTEVSPYDPQARFWDGTLRGAGLGILQGSTKVFDLGMTASRVMLRGQFPGMPDEPMEVLEQSHEAIRKDALELYTPDPNTLGTAGKVANGFAQLLPMLAAGGGTGFVAVPAMTLDTGKSLIDQGVDADTAARTAAITGAVTYAGFKIPFLGSTVPRRIATGAVGNVLVGGTGEALEKSSLEHGGYNELAAQYDPLDVTSRAVDLFVGAAFGAVAHQHAVPPSGRAAVAATNNAKHWQSDTAPGIPNGFAAWGAHQRAMKTALEQMMRGEEVSVPPDVTTATFEPRPARDPVHAAALATEVLGPLPDAAARDAAVFPPRRDASRGTGQMKMMDQLAEEARIIAEIQAKDPTVTRADAIRMAKEQMFPVDDGRPKPGSKEYLKQVVDIRSVPDLAFLSRDPKAYIAPGEGSATIPIEQLELSKTDTSSSGDNAIKRFAAASVGEIPKRQPVSVELDENGVYHVTDGNGTVTALKKMGLTHAIADVKLSESFLAKIDALEAPPEVKAGLKEHYENAARVKPGFDAGVRDISKEIGTPHEPMIPKELKGAERAAEKAAADYNNEAAQVADLVRATVVVDNFEQAQAAVEAATRKFGEPLKERSRNNLREDSESIDGYRDAKLVFNIDGQLVELQINFPEMLAAKEVGHTLYEERRTIQSKSEFTAEDDARIVELDAQMKPLYTDAWNAAMSRLNSASDISDPSSRAKLSDMGLPPGTSNAFTENAPLAPATVETGTPPTSQKTLSLPSGDTVNTSTDSLPEGAPGAEHITQGKLAGDQGVIKTVSTATGRKVQVRDKIIELEEAITSDKPEFPQAIQPRNRADRKQLHDQVRDIAQNLDPQRLMDSAEADRGASITDKRGVVVSGNGRIMALAHVYENLPAKAAEYRAALEAAGHNLEGKKRPVLVRELVDDMSDAELQKFSVEANQSATAAFSPVERAQADARILDGAVLGNLRGGEIASLQNAPFVRAFLEKIPNGERNELLNPDGTVNQAGVRRIQAALLAKAYGGKPESNATLGRMLESTDSDMRSALGAMLDAAPAFARLRQAIAEGKIAPEYDISGFLTQAIENVARLRLTGQSLRDFLAQTDAFTERAPIVDELMKTLYDKTGTRIAGREKIAASLTKYAGQATRQRLDQASMFAEEPIAPEKLVSETAKDDADSKPKVTDMFGLRTPQGGALDAAKQTLEEADVPVATGELDAAGNPVVRSGREVLAEAERGVEQAETESVKFEAAVNCFLTKGFDDAA